MKEVDDQRAKSGDSDEGAIEIASSSSGSWLFTSTGISSNLGLFISVLLTVLFVSLTLGVGVARGWNCFPDSGILSFYTLEDPGRFYPEPNINNTEDQLIPHRYGPYASANHYYWQLKDRSTWGAVLPWLLYFLHQISVWGTTFYFQLEKARHKLPYSLTLRKANVLSLGLNFLFCLLHLGKTHWTYDGIAIHVSEASSQGSVILLLSGIILMEYPRRGIFFGMGSKTSNYTLPPRPIELFTKYHGYFFSWAVVYTFWFHPAESSPIFALGFAHTTLILMQGSLMFTLAHKNVYWRFLLEIWVWAHGTVTALSAKQGNLWRMFFFGFSAVIVITQIHGLPFWMNHPHWAIRVTPFILWLTTVLAVYGSAKDWVGISEIIRIPPFLYGFCYVLWITHSVALRVQAKFPGVSFPKWVLGLGFFMIYLLLIGINVLFKVFNVQLDLLVAAAVLIAIFSVFIPWAALCVQGALKLSTTESS